MKIEDLIKRPTKHIKVLCEQIIEQRKELYALRAVAEAAEKNDIYNSVALCKALSAWRELDGK